MGVAHCRSEMPPYPADARAMSSPTAARWEASLLLLAPGRIAAATVLPSWIGRLSRDRFLLAAKLGATAFTAGSHLLRQDDGRLPLAAQGRLAKARAEREKERKTEKEKGKREGDVDI